MKKILSVTVIGLLLVGITIQLIPYGHNHPNPPVKAEPEWDNPETRSIAQRACFDCHSNETRWPWYSNIAPASWLVYRDVTEGRMHINFSDWDRPEEQHADEFQKVFDENSMPPAQYLLLHPEARLSADEKQELHDGLIMIAERYEQNKMATKPDTLKVSALQREEISANHADLFVTVKGSSVFSGDQALKKAKEVSQLVEALTSFGLSPEAIQLQGVHIEMSTGALLKSSSATYRLKINCEKLDQLAEILDIISSQKNATLERIAWKYNEDEARERALLATLEKAKSKAEKAAAAMGVKLLGVYDLIENAYDEEQPYQPFLAQAAPAKRAMGITASEQPSLGMDIQHSKTIIVGVEIWYRVSAF